ncbi:Arsenical resistance operon repressor [hydrothermal vent metagenome]|uniref:Arsenical resistance operon repressor n=1 Tax=hydrothermal vent metagenome TaxID=652676 RepID=A0A3B0TG57_9ZZZZ
MESNVCIRIEANIEQINNCKKIIVDLDNSFDLLSNTLSLAGNSVRLKILFLLSLEQKLCVCDLSDILSMKISAVSQHLRKLKDRGIIRPERKAQTILYSLTAEYEKIFSPFLKLLESNKIMEEV